MKTIILSEHTHKKLSVCKAVFGARSMNDTIDKLLKIGCHEIKLKEALDGINLKGKTI